MKKIVSFLLVVALACGCVSASFAENAVSKYGELMSGQWVCLSYASVSKNNYPQYYWISSETMIFPEGGKSEVLSDTYTLSLVGDDTGEVYLICTTKMGTTAGRVYLSDDSKTMLLITTDGAEFFYMKK